jgi:hypothetical protein
MSTNRVKPKQQSTGKQGSSNVATGAEQLKFRLKHIFTNNRQKKTVKVAEFYQEYVCEILQLINVKNLPV